MLLLGTAAPGHVGNLSEGGTAKVVEIVDGDTVLLDGAIEGSNEVRLVGIQAPKLPLGRKNFKKWPLADEARERLSKLVDGRQVTLKFGGRRMDRHGRLLAHLFTAEGSWVQGEMLKSGLARVYSFPDNRAVVDDMLRLEQTARQDGSGIWSHPYYRIQAPETLEKLIGTFQVIEGVVVDAQTVRDKTYLNFGADWRSDFTISLKKRVHTLFAQSGIDPLSLKGKWVRVRGWLKKRNGPLIEASHPEQIEILSK